MPIAVAKLGWGRRAWGVHAVSPAAAPGSPGCRLPEPGSGTQCSRPRLEGREARGGEGREEERGEEKRGEGGGKAEGGTEWLIVCVFVCAHVGGPTQCPTCVPDWRGQPGLLTSGSPPGGQRPCLAPSVANHFGGPAPGVLGGRSAASAGGSPAPSPPTLPGT